jgi:trans-aconitate methyltransferase
MKESRLFHPSSRAAGHGITIGTPRLYDLSANLIFVGTRRRSYRKLLEAAGVQSGDRTLDIGCGPGYFTRMLAETVGPAGSAVGIDAAPNTPGEQLVASRTADSQPARLSHWPFPTPRLMWWCPA